VEYDWDRRKRAANLAKHGLDLADAPIVFRDTVVEAPDDRRDYSERHIIAISRLGGRLETCGYTDRKTREGREVRRGQPAEGSGHAMAITRARLRDDGVVVQIMPDGREVPIESKTDWARVDAMTDEDIARAVAEDPDAAPLLTDEQLAEAKVVRSTSPPSAADWA
jgi:uncharacterized DUF497 family protein